MNYNQNMYYGKITLLIVFPLLISSLALNFYLLYEKSEQNRVVRVIDGDSFEVKNGRRIRLLSIDSPEKDRCLFNQARDRLKTLILTNKVYLKDTTTDDYGRLLANVYVKGVLINKIMLEEGFARFLSIRSPDFDNLKIAYAKARQNRVGIFSPVCRTDSPSPDCLIKGNFRQGDQVYFTPSCRNYTQVIIDESFGDRWFCSEDEAIKEGFRRAANC